MIYGRSQCFQHLFGEHQISERPFDPIWRNTVGTYGLTPDPIAEHVEGYGRRPDVRADGKGFSRSLATLSRQVEQVAAPSVSVGSPDLDHLALLERHQEIVDQRKR